MLKKLYTLFFFVILTCFTTGIVLAAAGPTEDLKPVLDDLAAILSDDSLKGKEHLSERRGKIMASVSKGFDFREMSRRVLGKTWREISSVEQDIFTTQMTKLLENVYVGKLEGYSGQAIEFVAETVKGERAQVTTLIENNQVKIPVHYIMRQTDKKWMVYDINIEGVSLVRNYQEQFKSILRKDDYKGLLKVLEEKNHTFAEEAK